MIRTYDDRASFTPTKGDAGVIKAYDDRVAPQEPFMQDLDPSAFNEADLEKTPLQLLGVKRMTGVILHGHSRDHPGKPLTAVGKRGFAGQRDIGGSNGFGHLRQVDLVTDSQSIIIINNRVLGAI